MSYGIEVKNSAGVTVLSTEKTSYYVYEEGTLSPDVSGTEVTDFSKVSALNYAYFLDDRYLHDWSERTNVSTWNSSTTYNFNDFVVVSGSIVSATRVYQCLKTHSNQDPRLNGDGVNGDGIYWRSKKMRDEYDRANNAIYTEMENKNSLIFFKLPNVNDVIMKHSFAQGNFSTYNEIDFECPVVTNLSSLSYVIIRPLTDFTPTTTGYGMQVFDASGNTIHVSNDKLAHVDNIAVQLGINSTIQSSGSTINWVSLPEYSVTVCNADYNTNPSGLRFTNYVKRSSTTAWKNEVITYAAGGQTYGDLQIIKTNFLIGRMD